MTSDNCELFLPELYRTIIINDNTHCIACVMPTTSDIYVECSTYNLLFNPHKLYTIIMLHLQLKNWNSK